MSLSILNNINPTAAIGSVVDNASNIVSTLLTNRANRKLAEYQTEVERQQIAEQNAYNSPAAQVQRYQEAGLNPNLIYGQINPGNQNQIARYSAPEMRAPVVSPVTEYFNVLNDIATVRKNFADAQGAEAEAAFKSWLNSSTEASTNKQLKYQQEYLNLVQRQNLMNSTMNLQAMQGAKINAYLNKYLPQWLKTSEQSRKTSERIYHWLPVMNIISGIQGLGNLGLGIYKGLKLPDFR